MVRKKVLIRKKDRKIITGGFIESLWSLTDRDESQELDDAKQRAGSGSSAPQQKLKERSSV